MVFDRGTSKRHFIEASPVLFDRALKNIPAERLTHRDSFAEVFTVRFPQRDSLCWSCFIVAIKDIRHFVKFKNGTYLTKIPYCVLLHHKEGQNFIFLIIVIACRKTSLAHPLCGFVFLKKCLYKFKSQSFFLSKNVLYKNFILHFHVHIKFICIFWEARISLSFNIFCCFSAF